MSRFYTIFPVGSAVAIFAFGWSVLGLNPAEASETPATAADLLRRVDQLYRAESSEAMLTMKITTPGWTRELKIRTWSQGMNKTLMRILEPKKDRGVATLRDDREMWNFFPKINKVIKVPPSMMMGSWMGSDFTNDDLVREVSLEQEYDAKLERKEGNLLLVLTPKAATATVWGRIEALIDSKSLLPKEQTYFDEKGVKVRQMRFRNVKDFGDRRLPSVMELVPLTKKGHSTTVTYESAKFNVKLPSNTFSLRNLQKGE